MTDASPSVLTTRLPMNHGGSIPQVGLGVYKVARERAVATVRTALEAGYRHVDTAALYRNEQEVGEAVRSGAVPREDVFVTTKVWNDDHGYDETLRAFDAAMDRLGLEHLDLYLVHWPVPARDRYVDTWRALVRLREEGRVRAIGVSNFEPHHLRRIVDETGVVPAVNQVELHPYLQQHVVRAANAELGVLTESWSPLARGGDLLADPIIGRIAAKHGRTPAQVVLRWHVDLGLVVIPKSVTPERIASNIALADFRLDAEDLGAIAGLDRDGRTGVHPDRLGG